MSGLLTIRSRNLRRFGVWQLALMQAGLFSSFALANEFEFVYDERLLPVTQTYLKLQLCTATALDFLKNETLADHYMHTAHAVSDAQDEIGWDKGESAFALTAAFEEISLLELREDDTRESFHRRHHSGKPCEQAMKQAQIYLEKGLPAPKSSGQ